MRYYIYLDKDFLKSLYSCVGESKFDIGIVDYSLQKSYSVTNAVSTAPSIENRSGDEKFKDKPKESSKISNNNSESKRIGISADKSDTYQTSTTTRYINIEDISQIRNNNFYHTLIDKLQNDFKKEKNMCYEYGRIYPCKLINRFREDEIKDEKSKFFRINNSYVWVDSQKLETDITFICNLVDKVHVIGFELNHDIFDNLNVLKAVAIYIE